MVVLPLSRLPNEYDAGVGASKAKASPTAAAEDSPNWVRIASAASLIAGGALLLTGRHRAGLVMAAAGTGLALVGQQETLSKWWALLPDYIDDIQTLINQAEGAVEEFAAQREKLGNAFSR
jgi:hypothetical protein